MGIFFFVSLPAEFLFCLNQGERDFSFVEAMASKSTTEPEKKSQASALLSKLKTILGPETYTEFQQKLKAWRDGSLCPSHLAHYLSTTFEGGGKEKLFEEVGSFLPANVKEEVRSLQKKRKREERGTEMLGGRKGGGTPVKRAVGGFDPLYGLSAVKTSPRPKPLFVTPSKAPPKSICLKPEDVLELASSPSSSTTSKTSSSSKSPTLSSKITSSSKSPSSSKASSPSPKTTSSSSSSTSSKPTPPPSSSSSSSSSSPSSKTSPASNQTPTPTPKPKPKLAPAPTKPTPTSKSKPKPLPAPTPTPTPTPTFLPTLDLSPSLYLFDTPKPDPDPSPSSSDDDDDDDIDPANAIKCSFCLEGIEQATAPKCGHVGCPPCWAKEFGDKKVMHCPLCKKTIFRHQLQPLFFG